MASTQTLLSEPPVPFLEQTKLVASPARSERWPLKKALPHREVLEGMVQDALGHGCVLNGELM